MNDGSMFSAFASYSDAGFAAEHDEILLQTPEGNARLRVVAVDVVDSNVEHSGSTSPQMKSSRLGSMSCSAGRT